jgi:hypothetical protein
MLELGVPFSGQMNGYLPPISIVGANAPDQLALFQSVEQTYCAVMADQEVSCQAANRRSVKISKGLNGEQHLVLVRFQALGASSLFTEVQEFPNLKADIAEGLIVTGRKVLHINIVSRYLCDSGDISL